MNSILDRASKSDIVEYPFPHIVIRNALDESTYESLVREFPCADVILNGREPRNNRYYRLCARDILSNSNVSVTWKDFTDLHVSAAFFRRFVELFGDHVRLLHPDFEQRLGKRLEDLETSIRFKEEFRDVALECQVTYNSPVIEACSSAVPHLDRECALFAGLLYFRLDGDDSDGGDLEFYRFVNPETADVHVARAKTIKYERNAFVLFLHSPASIHGVSIRSVTRLPRLYVNFVGEFQLNVFDPSANPGPFVAVG